MALNVTDPNTSPVSGIWAEQLMSLHDIYEPERIPSLFARYGSQYMPMFQIFRSLGREAPIARDEWDGWEENWYHSVITTTGTTVIGNAGVTVDITLASGDHDSNDNTYPRVGDIVSFPGSFLQAHITVKTETPGAHVLTLKPSKSTDQIPATTSGMELAITSGAFGAGTGNPPGTVLGQTKRDFVAQIFKETIGAEGSQLVNQKWIKMMDNNKNFKGWYSPGYMRGEYLMSLKIDGAFTWGDITNNVTVASGDGAGNAVKTTKGLMRWVTELGHEMDYTENAFAPEDLDEVGLYLKTQGITSGYVFGWCGNHFMNDVENGMVDYLASNAGGTVYTNTVKQVFKGNENLAVSIGFQSIKKGSITHILHPMDVWSNPKTFGATGYDLSKYGLFTPLSKFVDPKSNGILDNIATRYRAMDGYNRRFETWTVRGAGNGLKVTDVDKTNTFFRAHLGLQVFKANQMIMMKPA